MSEPTVTILESGYWLVRWSDHLFFQWPKGRDAEMRDGFGWVTEEHLRAANRAAVEHDQKGGER